MLELAGITFHLYGFLVGLGLVVAFSLMEKRLQKTTFPLAKLGWTMIVVGLGALIGARVYHVLTDWSLYVQNWSLSWQVWRGGLSIIGAVAGGVVALWGWARSQGWSAQTMYLFLDGAAFGLPFGQAIGRLGNWVNQELYGPPTHLPWGIRIDPAHRLAPYETATHFHPLFAYEALPLLLLGLVFWMYGKRPIGSGWYFWIYLTFYALLRLVLDFWRLDKMQLVVVGLGFNQCVMLGVLVISSITLVKRYYTPSHFRVTMSRDHGS